MRVLRKVGVADTQQYSEYSQVGHLVSIDKTSAPLRFRHFAAESMWSMTLRTRTMGYPLLKNMLFSPSSKQRLIGAMITVRNQPARYAVRQYPMHIIDYEGRPIDIGKKWTYEVEGAQERVDQFMNVLHFMDAVAQGRTVDLPQTLLELAPTVGKQDLIIPLQDSAPHDN